MDGKVVVVTGGAGYLGRRFCSAIAGIGGIAVVADRDIETARQIAAEIESAHPGLAEAQQLDITSKDSVAGLIEKLGNKYGHIDGVVNNAYPRNKNYGRKLDDVTYEDFCENVGLHLGGYFLVAQQFGLYFSNQGYGNIINISSIYGSMAPRFDVYEGTSMTMPVEYAAIKSSVNHLTRYFAQYFKRDGIRVNTLSPGGILEGQPQSFLERYDSYCGKKGMLESGDIIGTLLFLLSESSRYVTGQNIIVDDGFSL